MKDQAARVAHAPQPESRTPAREEEGEQSLGLLSEAAAPRPVAQADAQAHLAEVRAHEPVPVAHLLAELQTTRGTPEEQIAELAAKGERQVIELAGARDAKTRGLGAAAERIEAEGWSAVAEEKGRAGKATPGRAASLEDLAAQLARAVGDEERELDEQNVNAKADLHARFEAQRARLRGALDGQAAQLGGAIDAGQGKLRGAAGKETQAMQASAAGQASRLDAAESSDLIEAAAHDGQRLVAEAEAQAVQTIARGAAEAKELVEKASADAALARVNGIQQMLIARGQDDGAVRAQLALDTSEEAAQKIQQKGQDSAAKAKHTAEQGAQRLKAEAGQRAALLREQTKAAGKAMNDRIAAAKGRQDGDLAAAQARFEGHIVGLGSEGQAAAAKARAASTDQVNGELARLDAEETAASAKLDAQLARRRAAVETRAAAAEKKLRTGRPSDLASLERMVHRTTAEIDGASVQEAVEADALRKKAEQKAKGEILAAARVIAAHSQAAIATIQAAVKRAQRHIEIDAVAARRRLALGQREELAAVARERQQLEIGLEAEAARSEASLAAEAERQQVTIQGQAQAAEAVLAGMRGQLDADLKETMTADLTVAKQAAEQLDDAMSGLGTDEKKVFEALALARTPAERRMIKAAYKARTGHDLDEDLDDELGGSELKLAKAVESGDEVQIAVAKLEDSEGGFFSGPDGDRMHETLDGLATPEMKAKVARAYQRTTGKRLTTMLVDELGEEGLVAAQLPPLEDHLKVDPEKMKQVDQKAMARAAADLRKAMDGLGTKEESIHETLRGKTPEEIETIKDIYRRHYGVELIDQLEREMSGTDLKEASAALSGDAVDAAVASLENAMDGAGTDEKKLQRVLEGIVDPEQRRAVIDEFERQTGRKLSVAMDDEMLGLEGEIAQTLLIADNDARKATVAAIRLDAAAPELGADADAIFEALEGAKTKEEREAIAAAFEQRTHRSLKSMIEDQLRGTDRDIATALAQGDAAGAAAARLEDAAAGGFFGPREKGVFAQLEGKTDEEREALIAAYDARYGKQQGGVDFKEMLGQRLDGMDVEKARYLAASGTVPVDFALEYAMHGTGTDEEDIKTVLRGKKKGEIDEIREAYRLRYNGKDLDAALHGELSGRDDFDVTLMLEGEPEDAAGKLERARRTYEYERGGGEGSTAMGSGVTDLFSDAGADLDRTHEEMLVLEQKLKAEGVVRVGQDGKLEMVPGATLDADAQGKLEEGYDWQHLDVSNYQAAKDSITDGLAQAASVVVAGAVSVLTAGAAAPWAVAALSALYGGVAGMAIKAGMQGGAYGVEDMGIDAAKTVLSAATAGVMKTEMLAARIDKIAAFMSGPGSALTQKIMAASISGGGASALGAMTDAAFDGATRDPGEWLEHLLTSGGKGALSGAFGGAFGSVKYSRGQGLVGAAMGAPQSMRQAALRGMTTGLTGAVVPLAVSGAWDPSVFEGRLDDIAGKFVHTGAVGIVQGGLDSVADFRTAAHAQAHAPAPEPSAPEGAAAAPARPATMRMDAFVEAPPVRTTDRMPGVRPEIHTPEQALMLVNRMPGGARVQGITPDDWPNVPGCLRHSDAAMLLHAYDAMGQTPTGQATMRILAEHGVGITMDKGVGSFFSSGPPPRINIDPSQHSDGHVVAGSLAHEAHHAATYTRDVRKDSQKRGEFIGAAMRNEAEAQSALFEHHREAGLGGVDHEFGHAEYHAEYDHVAWQYRDAGLSAEQLHNVAREAAISKLEGLFADAVPSTSLTTDPQTGLSVMKPGAARNYRELTGRTWDNATRYRRFMAKMRGKLGGGETGDPARPANIKVLDLDEQPKVRTPSRSYEPAEALAILGKLPGAGHFEGIIPDDWPAVPGCLRQSDAEKLIQAYDLMLMTPSGRKALETIGEKNVKVTMERGQGHFRVGGEEPRINLDPEQARDVYFLAGTAVHEAHHAATIPRDVLPQSGDRDRYREASLRNEAEAQASLFEHHRELAQLLGEDHSQGDSGHLVYHTEYDRVIAAYKDSPLMADMGDTLHGIAREIATQKLQEHWAHLAPSGSLMRDPASGLVTFKPDAPQTYTEVFDGHWDSRHGADTLRSPGRGRAPDYQTMSRAEHLAHLASITDPQERLDAWREVHRLHAARQLEESVAATKADATLNDDQKDRRELASRDIWVYTVREIDEEIAHLESSWDRHGPEEKRALVDALIARKQYEHEIEMRHNVNIKNDVDEYVGSKSMNHRPRARRTWSMEQLTLIDATLNRIPAEHILGKGLLPPQTGATGPTKQSPGLHFTRSKVANRWSDAKHQWEDQERISGTHSGGNIRAYDLIFKLRPLGREDRLAGHLHDGPPGHGPLTSLESTITHEIGHNVERAHGGPTPGKPSEPGSVSEAFRAAGGWSATPFTREQLLSELTALGPVGHGLSEEKAEQLVARLENGPRSQYPRSTPEEATGDRAYLVDQYSPGKFQRRSRGFVPEAEEDTRRIWAYAPTNPGEAFAEQYEMAVQTPVQYHRDMIEAPQEAIGECQAELAAAEAALAAATTKRERNRAALQVSAAHSELYDAQAVQSARRKQHDLLRNGVFRTDEAVARAKALLEALPATSPLAVQARAFRIERFENEAQVAMTPIQVESLRAEAQADIETVLP